MDKRIEHLLISRYEKFSYHKIPNLCLKNQHSNYITAKIIFQEVSKKADFRLSLQISRFKIHGCGVSSNTFIHHLEHIFDCSFLENAIVKVKESSGRLCTEVIHKHLPGCRDFYHHRKPTSKFYLRTIERGLELKKVNFGTDSIYLMDLSELYRIGCEVFREDPNVTLCDDPNCYFCKKYKR